MNKSAKYGLLFGVIMAIAFSVLFSIVFSDTLGTGAGIGIGIGIGACFGCSFALFGSRMSVSDRYEDCFDYDLDDDFDYDLEDDFGGFDDRASNNNEAQHNAESACLPKDEGKPRQSSAAVRRTLTALLLLALVVTAAIFILPAIEKNRTTGMDDSNDVPIEEVYVPQSVSCGDVVAFIGSPLTLSCPEVREWSGYDREIISVSEDGTVEVAACGDTKLVARAANGDTYEWNVKARKAAYLTFDDFPNENTLSILDTLDEKGVKAGFFLCRIPKDSEFFGMYKEIADRGHTLGNHTSSHKDSLFKSSDNLISGFRRMEEYLGEMGYQTKFIRLPYGSADPSALGVRKVACRRLREMGYSIVDWSALTNDSYRSEFEDQKNSLRRTLGEDSEIILMHHKRSTAKNLGMIIDYIRSNGYEFDTMEHAPMLYSQLYKWEENINREGSDKATPLLLTANPS